MSDTLVSDVMVPLGALVTLQEGDVVNEDVRLRVAKATQPTVPVLAKAGKRAPGGFGGVVPSRAVLLARDGVSVSDLPRRSRLDVSVSPTTSLERALRVMRDAKTQWLWVVMDNPNGGGVLVGAMGLSHVVSRLLSNASPPSSSWASPHDEGALDADECDVVVRLSW